MRTRSKAVRVLRDIVAIEVDIATIQETHFVGPEDCDVLVDDFNVYSAYGNPRSRGVSVLVSRTLAASVTVVHTDAHGRLVVVDVAVKSGKFRILAVYAVQTERTRKRPFLPGERICEVDASQGQVELSASQKKNLKTLGKFTKVDGMKVERPTNFREAPMLITFLRKEKGARANTLWRMVAEARQAFPGLKIVDEHPSLMQIAVKCDGRVPIYVHPPLYRALKITFPLDVAGLVRGGQFTTELLTGRMGQSFGVLTPEYFRPAFDEYY